MVLLAWLGKISASEAKLIRPYSSTPAGDRYVGADVLARGTASIWASCIPAHISRYFVFLLIGIFARYPLAAMVSVLLTSPIQTLPRPDPWLACWENCVLDRCCPALGLDQSAAFGSMWGSRAAKRCAQSVKYWLYGPSLLSDRTRRGSA